MKFNKMGTASLSLVAACSVAVPALAQSQSALEARIAALEAKAAAAPVFTPKSALGLDLSFYGYVQGEVQRDSDYDLGLNGGGIAAITPSTATGDHTRVHAYQSRFGLRGSKDTDGGKLTFNIEGDFYGGGGGQFRLRHAYGSWGGLLAGQTWSVFGVSTGTGGPSGPLDFNGVFGAPGPRVAQIRYTHEFDQALKASFSLEEDNNATNQDRPSIAAALRWSEGKNTFAISGISRAIKYNTTSTDGWGLQIGAQVSPWEGATLEASALTGSGIASYLQGNPYARLTPAAYFQSDLDATGKALDASAYTIGLTQKINDQFEVSAAYGLNKYKRGFGTPDIGLEQLDSAHLTLKYKPIKELMVGVEYIKSRKTLYNGTDFKNDRILGVVRYSF